MMDFTSGNTCVCICTGKVAVGVIASCCVAVATYKFFFQKPSSCSTSIVRQQGPTDKSYALGAAEDALARFAMERQGDMKVGVVLRLSPLVDMTPDRFREAVSRLQRRHPILRLVLRQSTKDKLILVPSDDEELPEIEFNNQGDAETWRTVWQTLEKQPLKLGEITFRFALVQSTTATDVIVVAHHAFTDGKSISSLAHELLMAMTNDDAMDMLPMITTLETNCWNSLAYPRLPRFIYRILNLTVRMRGVVVGAVLPFDDNTITANAIEDRCTSIFVNVKLNVPQSNALVAECRANRTTVTGAIMAALMAASSEFVKDRDGGGGTNTNDTTTTNAKPGERRIQVACGADSRKHYSTVIDATHLGFHVGGVGVYSQLVSTQCDVLQLWDVAQKFRESVKDSIGHDDVVTIGLLMGMVYAKDLKTPAFKPGLPTTSLSNWGRLPFTSHYGDAKLIDMKPIINVNFVGMPIVLVTTTNNEITVTFLAPTPLFSPGSLQQLSDAFSKYIHIMITPQK